MSELRDRFGALGSCLGDLARKANFFVWLNQDPNSWSILYLYDIMEMEMVQKNQSLLQRNMSEFRDRLGTLGSCLGDLAGKANFFVWLNYDPNLWSIVAQYNSIEMGKG